MAIARARVSTPLASMNSNAFHCQYKIIHILHTDGRKNKRFMWEQQQSYIPQTYSFITAHNTSHTHTLRHLVVVVVVVARNEIFRISIVYAMPLHPIYCMHNVCYAWFLICVYHAFCIAHFRFARASHINMVHMIGGNGRPVTRRRYKAKGISKTDCECIHEAVIRRGNIYNIYFKTTRKV